MWWLYDCMIVLNSHLTEVMKWCFQIFVCDIDRNFFSLRVSKRWQVSSFDSSLKWMKWKKQVLTESKAIRIFSFGLCTAKCKILRPCLPRALSTSSLAVFSNSKTVTRNTQYSALQNNLIGEFFSYEDSFKYQKNKSVPCSKSSLTTASRRVKEWDDGSLGLDFLGPSFCSLKSLESFVSFESFGVFFGLLKLWTKMSSDLVSSDRKKKKSNQFFDFFNNTV